MVAAASGELVSGIVATTTLWEEIVDAIHAVNGGPHPGYRAVHAKGTVCKGTFTPTPEASKLSRAAHLQGDPVEATSASRTRAGTPRPPMPTRSPAAAWRSSSTCPTGRRPTSSRCRSSSSSSATPEDFLEFTRARIPDPETGQPDPEKLAPSSARTRRPASRCRRACPSSPRRPASPPPTTAALHAFALVDADGEKHWGRYTWEPEAGTEYLTDEQRDAAGRDYLQEEIRERLGDRHRALHARVHPGQGGRLRSTIRPRNGRASARWSSSASSR